MVFQRATDFSGAVGVRTRNEGLCGDRSHGYRCESNTRYECTNRFFDIKVREILAKPRGFQVVSMAS